MFIVSDLRGAEWDFWSPFCAKFPNFFPKHTAGSAPMAVNRWDVNRILRQSAGRITPSRPRSDKLGPDWAHRTFGKLQFLAPARLTDYRSRRSWFGGSVRWLCCGRSPLLDSGGGFGADLAG